MKTVQGHAIAHLTPKYSGKWVALTPSGRKVLGSAKTARSLLRKVRDPKVIFYKVLPPDVNFAPHCS